MAPVIHVWVVHPVLQVFMSATNYNIIVACSRSTGQSSGVLCCPGNSVHLWPQSAK